MTTKKEIVMKQTLEQAAEELKPKCKYYSRYGCDISPMKDCNLCERNPQPHWKEGFKAGAEWHARQGQTFESVVWQDSDDKLFVEAFVDENKFKMADNVVIQVIKKDNN